jgi:hypothetical protein
VKKINLKATGLTKSCNLLSCVALILATSGLHMSCTKDATYLKAERKPVLYILVIGFTMLEE